MISDDEQYADAFGEGRLAARTGRPLLSNPHLDSQSSAVAAWADGFKSVDTSQLSSEDRFRIFQEGRMAGERGQSASLSPYLADDDPELLELWLIGFAPNI